MPDRAERLMDLAAALSDGLPIDWNAVESSAASDSERRQIAQMRLVGNIAAAQSGGDWHGGGVHDSLLHPPPGPASSDAPPVTWGPLQVIEKIGRGRFGDVYRALEPRLDREVALKLLRHREHDANLEVVVIDEGRLLAKVRHPNVVAVYGAERIDGRVGVWMELIRGRTLEEELAAGGVFDAARVAETGIGICGALAAVHRAGLVHRDVKAQNVMRDRDGRLVLMDFGTGREIDLLDESDLAGTPLYLAPEVLNGDGPSPSADVYSVGVLLYHLATGDFPVRGATLREVKAAHRTGASTSIRRDLAALPAALVAVIEQALSADPTRRFANADQMAGALHAASRPRWRARRWMVAGIAAAILAALGVGTLVAPWRSRGGQAGEVTQVCEDCVAVGLPSVSADGTRMAFTEPTGGDIAIRDLATGTITPLQLRRGGWNAPADLAMFPVLSRDGRFVAHAAIPQAQGRPPGIRVVGVKPGSPPRVLEIGADLDLAIPLDWSPDGRSVLADLTRTTGAREIAWVSMNGAVTLVKELPESMHRGQIAAAVSPDGRHIAYGVVPDDNSRQPRMPLPPLHVMSADGRDDVPLSTAAAGWSSRPFWTPDGNRVLFISNLAGTVDAWSVPVSHGRPQGTPAVVRRDIGSARPFGITRAGLYYFYESPAPVAQAHIWQLADGAGGSPRITRTLVGEKPAWSPDGKSIALIRRAPSNENANTIVVQTLDTGVERLYEHQGLGSHLPLWLGDGTALITGIREGPQEVSWHRLDLASGTFTRLARNRGDPAHKTHWTIRALAPDGKTLYFGTYASADPETTAIDRVVAVDLATGRHATVFRLPGAPDSLPQSASDFAIALSPDGRTLLLQTSHPKTNQSIVATVAVDGSGYRVRHGPFEAPGAISEKLAWSADGRWIIFTAAGAPRAEGQGKQFRVMRLRVDAEQAEFTGVEADWMWSLAASPDATSVVFGGATAGARSGVWALNLHYPRGSSK